MAINIKWHKTHKLHKSAGLEARIDWHVKHEKHCACRPIPDKIKKEIEKKSTKRR